MNRAHNPPQPVVEAPACLLCHQPTGLLYPSNVPSGEAIRSGEMACTSPYLCIHDDIYSCPSCGLARSVPPVGQDDLDALYGAVEDPDYLVSEKERRASFRETLALIERYHPPGRLLEVGSAVGLFLDEARRNGWEVLGIEPSRWAADQARSRDLKICNGTLETFPLDDGPFDAVVLWDVLEHLFDPMAALERTADLLESGGIMSLTTVNIGGLGARLSRGRWPWFMRMHLHYFTRRSLIAMAERVGFEVLDLTTQSKVLKLGYVLERARGIFGPLAGSGLWLAERLRLDERPIRINLGDILLLIARKK